MNTEIRQIVNTLTVNNAIKKGFETVCITVVALSNLEPALASSKVTMTEQNTPNSTLIANWDFGQFGNDVFNGVQQGWDYYNPSNAVPPVNNTPSDNWGRGIFDYGVDKLKKVPGFQPGAYILDGLANLCDTYQCFTPIRAQD